jgi:hypothetical protein
VLCYGDLECEADSSLLVADDFTRREPTLRWCADDDFDHFKRDIRLGATESGFAPALLRFVVTARTGSLKTCEIVLTHPVSECHGLDNPSRIGRRPDGSRPDAFCADSHGAVVDVYVALARDVNVSAGHPLRPSRAGTWLAHATFRLRCESDAELFRPVPLDDGERERLGLTEGTVSFTEFDDDIADPSSGVEAATFWVDDGLLAAIDAQARSPQAAQLQRQLMVAFLSDVIAGYASRRREDETGAGDDYSDVKDSLIGRVVRLLADRVKPGRDRDQVLRTVRENPAEAVAMAQDACGLLVAARKSMEPQE